jgi:hypothetical protein
LWNVTRRARATVLLVGMSVGACGGAGAESASVSRAEISGGEPTLAGAWPTVTWLDSGCSGVLVAPDLVVSAAHCGISARVASFGDVLDIRLDEATQTASVLAGAGISSVAVLGCTAYPDWSYAAGNDIAFCVLAKPALAASSIAPPLLACARSKLEIGSEATLVGFGQSTVGDALGVKRSVRLPITAIDPELRLGDATHGTCAGDSGSPAMVALGDTEHPDWHVAGVLSSGIAGDGCGLSYYTRLSTFVPWLEQTSGRSLTPCLAADGSPTASRSCASAALDAAGEPDANAISIGLTCSATPSSTDASCAFSFRRGQLRALETFGLFATLGVLLKSRRARRT